MRKVYLEVKHRLVLTLPEGADVQETVGALEFSQENLDAGSQVEDSQLLDVVVTDSK